MADWAESQRMSYPAKGEAYSKLADLHRRKLWHQLTDSLLEFVQLPAQPGENLVDLYYKFIKEFEGKINPVRLVQILTIISRQLPDSDSAVAFFVQLADKVSANKEALVLCRVELAQLKRKAGIMGETKSIIEETQKVLDSIAGPEVAVSAAFYRLVSDYHKVVGPPADFYKNALLFLSYTPLESIPQKEKQELAFDLGIAALVGEGIYNFGELLGHPIFQLLTGTPEEWLARLLKAFNAGNIPEYDRIKQAHAQQMNAQPALVANQALLTEKITILCLMELIFRRGAEDRNVPFKVVADAARIPLNEVEMLFMRALSLKLLRGSIDEVEKVFRVDWVQPRVLDSDQISHLKTRLEQWSAGVKQTLLFLENETPELFV
eukprot:tig00000802_g4296.t1